VQNQTSMRVMMTCLGSDHCCPQQTSLEYPNRIRVLVLQDKFSSCCLLCQSPELQMFPCHVLLALPRHIHTYLVEQGWLGRFFYVDLDMQS